MVLVFSEEKQVGIMAKHFKDKMECALNLLSISPFGWSKKRIASDLR